MRESLGLGGRLARASLRTTLGERLLLAGIQALDALDADQPLSLLEPDEPYPLGVASLHGDLIHRGAHQRTAGADEHDLLPRHHLQRRHRDAIAVRCLQRDHALPATPVRRKFLPRRTL